VAEKSLDFLELFYDAIMTLSGVYYPTSPLIMHNILDIVQHLNQYENDALLRHVIAPMKSKFLKYRKDIHMLYAFAFILDPCNTQSCIQRITERAPHFVSHFAS
jgi:hypothetical protein